MDSYKNLACTTVLQAPSPPASGTSLHVAVGDGTIFPAVPFNATIWPSGFLPVPSNSEIVRVTNITGDTLTITRAQESTSARTVLVGDQIAATLTAKYITDVQATVDTVSQAVSVETAARVAKDDTLSQGLSVISQLLSVAIVSIAATSNALSNETSIRTAKDDVVSNAVSIVSQALSSQAAALSVRIDTQSQSVSVLSQQVSVLSQAHSVLSQAHSVLSQQVSVLSSLVSVVSVAVTSVDSRVNTVSNLVSALTSAHNALSNTVSDSLSAGTVASNSLSQLNSVVSQLLSTLKGGTTGQVLKKSANADFNWSWQADATGGSSSAGITSNAISILSQQISVLSQAHSVLSQAHSVLSQVVSVLSNATSNALSVANAASNAASIVSTAASNALSVANAASNAASIVSQALSSQAAALSVRIDTQSQSVSVLSQQVSILSQTVSAISQLLSTLKGGTTGQVLKKSANGDYLWTWAADLTGGSGSATVTSNEISIISQALSVHSQALSVHSQALSVTSQALSVETVGRKRLAFHVADYGAVGDGTTDDGNALSNALSACAAAGGGDVLFDAKTYLISAGTGLLITKPNVRLIGRGASHGNWDTLSGQPSTGTIIRSNATSVLWCMAYVPANGTSPITGVRVEGISFDANNKSPYGLVLGTVQGSHFENLYFANATTADLVIEPLGLPSVVNGNRGCMRNTFVNITAWNDLTDGDGILLDGDASIVTSAANANNNDFLGVQTLTKGGIGIHIKNADSNRFWGAAVNTISTTGAGVVLDGASFAGGEARDNTFYGLTPTGKLAARAGTTPSHDNRLVGINQNEGSVVISVVAGAGLFFNYDSEDPSQSRLSPDRGDNSVTVLTPGVDAPVQYFNTPFTSAHTVSLAVSAITGSPLSPGAHFMILRTAAATGAPALTVNSVTLQAGQYSNVVWNGTSWVTLHTGFQKDTLSNLLSIASQNLSVLSQQVSVLSQQVSVLSQQVSVLSQTVSIISAGLGLPQMHAMANATTISATGLTNVSGMSISVTSAAAYEIQGRLMFTLSAVNVAKFGMTFPAAMTGGGILFSSLLSVVAGNAPSLISTNAAVGYAAGGGFSTVGSIIISAVYGASATQYAMEIAGVVQTGATAGTIQVQAAVSAAATTLVFQKGSFIRAFRLV